jgi:hypothetical protein
MKTITTTILLFLVLSAVAQEQYDVRKTKWGMAISEVMASEYPLTPSETKVDELKYSYVELSNGHKATILYSFTNAKLTEVRYIMYGYNAEFSRGTCTNIIPLYDKIKYTNFVFEALKSKGMKCDMGWYLVNCSNAYPVGYSNCNLTKETADKIEKAAIDINCERIGLNYENERTDAVFYFNQYPNLKTKSSFDPPCNSDFYNTYYWLVFTPSYKLKNEMKKGDF